MCRELRRLHREHPETGDCPRGNAVPNSRQAELPHRCNHGTTPMRSIRLALVAVLLVGATVAAAAQSDYPDRNIRLLFGFAPGVDTAARLMADRLGDALGKAVIVENVTGGSGHIAVDHVVRASPDGYTIGVMPAGNVVVDGQLYKHLPYNPLKDLVPVAQVYGYTDVLVINNDVPARTPLELAALARAKPGQLTYGHSGIGTSLHLAGELFKAMAHADIQQVPFRGSTLVITDVIGGRVTMSFIPPTGTLSIIQEKKVRALAVTSLKRVPFLPDLPTMVESRVPGLRRHYVVGHVRAGRNAGRRHRAGSIARR